MEMSSRPTKAQRAGAAAGADGDEPTPGKNGDHHALGDNEAAPSVATADTLTDCKAQAEEHAEASKKDLMAERETLAKLIAKVGESDDDKKKLEQYDMQDALSNGEKQLEGMEKALKKLRNCKLVAYTPAHDELLQHQAGCKVLTEELQGYGRVCKKYLLERTEATKQVRGKQQYQQGKRTNNFLDQGCGRARSNIASLMMFHHKDGGDDEVWVKCRTETEPFNAEVVSCWKKDGSPIQEYLAAVAEQIEGAEAKVVASLAKKSHAALRGVFKQVENVKGKLPTAWPEPLSAVPPLLLDGAFSPFAVAIRRFTLRVGFSSFPMAGCGGFICVQKGELCVAAVDTSILADKADFKLLEQFDEALDSKHVAKVIWPMLRLTEGMVAWMPFGVLPLVTCSEEETGTFTLVPWMTDSLYKKAKEQGDGPEVVVEGLEKHAKKKIAESPWDVVSPPLTEFLERCK